MRNAIVATLIFLTGCAADRLAAERRNLAGHPIEYQDGYVDGCSTGTKAAGNPYYEFRKDIRRFDADRLYAQGWTDGFNICKANYESIGRGLR